MAQIKFYKNMFEEDFVLQEYDTSKTLIQQIKEFSTESAYVQDYVECYDPETGETFYEPLVEEIDTPCVLITVNGVSVKEDYEVREKGIICVTYLPLSDMSAEGMGWGSLIGFAITATILAVAGVFTGGVTWWALAALAGGTLAGSLIGGLVGPDNSLSSSKKEGKEGEARPDAKGASNQSLANNVYPFTIGKHLAYPSIVGDPYTEYVGEKGEDAYIRVLYCLGYGPLKMTDFKLGDIFLAHNQSFGNVTKDTVLRGLLKGSSDNGDDDGDISVYWKDNDVELELIQNNPYLNSVSANTQSIIYPEKVRQEEINANILFVSDESLEEQAKVTYKNVSFPKNFRTNTVFFTESCPKEFTITIDAPSGLYSSRNKQTKSKKSSTSEVQYEKISLFLMVQWRPYNKNNAPSDDNARDYDSWNNITVWNGKDCGVTFDIVKATFDKAVHRGNELTSDIYETFYGKTVTNLMDFTGEDSVSQIRLSSTVTLTKEQCKEMLSDDNTMNSIEIRVLRISPCYIDEKESTTDDSDVNYGATSYSDILKVSTVVTKCFDRLELRDNNNLVPVRSFSKKDSEKFVYVAIKAKADSVGNISESLGELNCMVESFSPIWENHKWLPENVKRITKYYGYCQKLEEQPIDFIYNFNNYFKLEDKTFVRITDNNYGGPYYVPVDMSSNVVEKEVSKELYEEMRQKGLNWHAWQCGTDFVDKMKSIIYNGSEIYKNGYPCNILTDEARKYNCALSSSSFMLGCVGQQNGPVALGYEQINTLSVGEWNDDIVDITDGSTDDNGNIVHFKMEANGYVSQGQKLEDLLKALAATGRAVYTYDSEGKIKIVMDKKVDYPDGVITQENRLDLSVAFNYEQPPAGLRISFADENDGYNQNSFFCWSDGNSIDNYKGEVVPFSIPFVTNNRQAFSLGRYFQATSIFNKEIATAKLGIESAIYELGDVLAVQSDELMIGDGSGRIQEVLEKDGLVYGFVMDATYNYSGETEIVGTLERSVQGVSILQPKKFGNSRLVTLRLAPEGRVFDKGTDIYILTKGITNLVLFENPITFDTSNDPSVKNTTVYDFKTGDLCMFGLYKKIYSRYRVIKVKPEKEGKATYTLINYDDRLYNYGAKLPTFQNNMTSRPVLKDGITLSDVPVNIKELNQKLKESVDLASLSTPASLSIVTNGGYIFKKSNAIYTPESITLSAILSGGLETCQWYKDDVLIEENSLSITVTPENAGVYKCVSDDYYDVVSVMVLEDSTNNYAINVSNENFSIPTDIELNIFETGSTTITIDVYKGTTALVPVSQNVSAGMYFVEVPEYSPLVITKESDNKTLKISWQKGVELPSATQSITVNINVEGTTLQKSIFISAISQGVQGESSYLVECPDYVLVNTDASGKTTSNFSVSVQYKAYRGQTALTPTLNEPTTGQFRVVTPTGLSIGTCSQVVAGTLVYTINSGVDCSAINDIDVTIQLEGVE